MKKLMLIRVRTSWIYKIVLLDGLTLFEGTAGRFRQNYMVNLFWES